MALKYSPAPNPSNHVVEQEVILIQTKTESYDMAYICSASVKISIVCEEKSGKRTNIMIINIFTYFLRHLL